MANNYQTYLKVEEVQLLEGITIESNQGIMYSIAHGVTNAIGLVGYAINGNTQVRLTNYHLSGNNVIFYLKNTLSSEQTITSFVAYILYAE